MAKRPRKSSFLTHSFKICYYLSMELVPPISRQDLKETARILIESSSLLDDAARVGLLGEITQCRDHDELSEICRFLQGEKQFIIAYLRYLLAENRIPREIPVLMSDLKRDYARRMYEREVADSTSEQKDILRSLEII